MAKRGLPFTDPTFQEIIQGNLLYADKTKYIHLMIKDFKFVFLSRPRRFGKTLLLDVAEELFLGNQELFRDLWIGSDSDYAFQRHPVLRFDMSYDGLATKEDLEENIKADLRRIAKKEGFTVIASSCGRMLEEILEGVSEKYGIGAVILVDEYDDPVSSLISHRKLASGFLDVLRGFYKALKKLKKYIRFALVTGVTRYAMSAMDSGANNFMDISLSPEYAGVCGFSVSEFDTLFRDRFADALKSLKINGNIDQDADDKTLVAKILEWYDGYNWLGAEQVLNPYSIISFFYRNEFGDYWPSSGKPSHLSALVRKRPLEFIQPNLDGYPAEQIGKVDLGQKIEAVPVLFHSGYLTIDSVIYRDRTINGKTVKEKAFTFRTPNLEVALNFRESFFKAAFDLGKSEFNDFAENLPKAFLNRDSGKTAGLIHDLLAGIASIRHKSSEKFYHAVLQAAFLAAGLEVLCEVRSGYGRSDMVVLLDDRIRVVIELKYLQADESDCNGEGILSEKEFTASLDAAEKQIRVRDYSGAHRLPAMEIICLALTIRGKYEVAARYLEPEKDDIPKTP
jgi:hypothetical protein